MKKNFVLLLSVISFTTFAQTPTGKIVVKKGQHFVIVSNSEGNVTQEMMGQNMEMKIGSATKLSADIKDSKSNNYTITQTLTSMKSTFSGMGQEKSFDSDKKEDMAGEAGAMYKDKLNVPKDVEITNEGKSLVVADTTKRDSTGGDNPMSAIMEMIGGGQDNVAGVLFLVIPIGKKVGDTWQDSTISEGVKLKRMYTLNSIADKQAAVTVNSVLNVNKSMQLQGMDMNAVMTSKIVSAVLVDVLSNIQKENKSTMDVTGTIDVMGQSVPITAKATSVTSVKML
ncbi:DUF6263 family protein [Ferruginibacter sp.]|uniref:DUF6263 family protein n=1 Tax=Ferruginibacter sp. TaxID=1940288 RepID=UPI00265B1EEA|nr:DUF6263 family protein [Ferruginibacter sp.]